MTFNNQNINVMINCKSKLFIFLLTVLCIDLQGQDYHFKNYDFSNTTIEIPELFKDEKEIVLSLNKKSEIINEKESTVVINLTHEKVLLNSNDAIERNNKIYLPFRDKESVLVNKVRVILKNGKIIHFNDKEIKQESDSETGLTYNYFAVSGLEVGAIIEKLFILKNIPSLNDNEVTVQGNRPIVNFTYELIYPKHLKFKYKSYNGLPEAKEVEDGYKDCNAISVRDSNVVTMEEKVKYGNEQRYSRYFRYMLNSNTATGAKNMFNYKEFAGSVYDLLYKEQEKKVIKQMDDFIKIPEKLPLFDKVVLVENKVKGAINIDKYFSGSDDLAGTIKSKKANEVEIIKLYVALFNHHNVKNEVVFTTNRFDKFFDPEFETTGNLVEMLIYLPDLKMYLDPVNVEYRLPLFNFTYGNNSGLFIKEKEFGGAKMGIGKVEKIPLPDITKDTMNIVIDLSKDPENPIVDSELKFFGYAALNFQPIKDYAPAERFNDIIKDIAKNYSIENDEYEKIQTENDGLVNVGKKPYIIRLKFNSPNLVQKAGDTYLVKVGETIGRQSELYDAKERSIPVEINYPHHYTRNITLILPEGYKVANADESKMNLVTMVEGSKDAVFESTYTLQDNKIVITNTEYYSKIEYPISVYKDYREVINAAADFNKIVLVLKK